MIPGFAILLTFLVGCAAPWQVVKQADPNPMLGKRKFGLAPINFRGLRVGEKTEQDYLAKKSDETRAKWVGDKHRMNRNFRESLIAEASEAGIEIERGGASDFTLVPRVRWLEPGWNVGVAQKRSKVRMTLAIMDSDGNVVDTIKLKHRTEGYTTRGRLEDDAEALGEMAADYVKLRATGEAP